MDDVDFQNLIDSWQENCPSGFEPLEDLARELGVSEKSLRDIGIGYAPIVEIGNYTIHTGAWAFPERDGAGKVVGIAIRECHPTDPKKNKTCLKGGQRGLTYSFSGDYRDELSRGTQGWVRIAKHNLKCPICGRESGCRVDAANPADPSAVLCCRESKGSVRKYQQEWLHILKPREKEKQKSGPLNPPSDEEPLLIVEGATDVAAALSLGCVAVGRPSAGGGADMLKVLIRSRCVVVMGENDSGAGVEGMNTTMQALRQQGRTVVGCLPPAPIKDLRAWLQAGGLTKEKLYKYIKDHPILAPEEARAKGRNRASTMLAGLVEELEEKGTRFFTDSGTIYASVLLDGYRECLPIDRGAFKGYLNRYCVEVYNETVDKTGAEEILNRIKAKTLRAEPTFIRVGHTDAVWLDLCNTDRQVVRVNAEGWTVVSNEECPVNFIRPPAAEALPIPLLNDDFRLQDFLTFLRLYDPEYEAAVAAWLLGVFLPVGTVPMLAVCGKTGAGKTWTARALRCLLDPRKRNSLVCQEPKRADDLANQIKHARVIAFDNMSHVDNAMSDAYCAMSTGADFQKRALFTNDDMLSYNRPVSVILNGIPSDMFERGDMRSRINLVRLRPFHRNADGIEVGQLSEIAFWQRFSEMWPGVLGHLLSGVVAALGPDPAEIVLSEHRMQDYIVWARKGLPALKIDPVVLETRLRKEKIQSLADSAGSSLLVYAVSSFMKSGGKEQWIGSVADLWLEMKIAGVTPPWSSGRVISANLKREIDELELAGYAVSQYNQENGGLTQLVIRSIE